MVDYQGTAPITGPTVISTVAPSGTEPGTFIIATQAAIFFTSSVQYSGTGTLTGPSAISTIQPVGTQAGTVIIATPAPDPSYVTTTIFLTATDAADSTTITTIPPSGTSPGIIVMGRRASFVTVVGPYTATTDIPTGPTTVSIVQPSDTQAGTQHRFAICFSYFNLDFCFFDLIDNRFHFLYAYEVLIVLFQLIFTKLFIFTKFFHQPRVQPHVFGLTQ
ncbi:hypothetical protein LY76DRAFT_686934 [Colletotrichum caudatum]|nr:hypothetical protein LY76DRAFT_686934 [Colletotrichum caudatum]